MPQHPKPDPEKFCAHCRKRLSRKRFNGVLESNLAFRRRVYCDRACMAAAMEGKIKSLTPHNSRNQARKRRGRACQNCGRADTRLCVHHIDANPFNNDPANLQTLCGSCHRRRHMQSRQETFGPPPTCEYCASPSRKAGMCQKHYQRFRKYGDPFLTKRKKGSTYVIVQDAT